ncbi:MAG: response regulator [Syntrophobacteraceae bacterium]
MAIRVVLSDDHPLILNGLTALLTAAEGFEVLAGCTNGEDALKAVQDLAPDILVLDVRMPGKDGMGVLQELHNLGSPVKVVLLTGEISEEQVAIAVRHGVRGIVLKESAPQVLVSCLHKVFSGGRWLETGSFYEAMETTLHREKNREQLRLTLTTREIEMVKMVQEGLKNREISERLCIAEATVKTHLYHIYRKLNVESRAQLVRYAHVKKLFPE